MLPGKGSEKSEFSTWHTDYFAIIQVCMAGKGKLVFPSSLYVVSKPDEDRSTCSSLFVADLKFQRYGHYKNDRRVFCINQVFVSIKRIKISTVYGWWAGHHFTN